MTRLKGLFHLLCITTIYVQGVLNSLPPKLKRKTYQGCILEKDQYVFGALPGLGWDILRAINMGRVLELDYTNCLLTEDRKFLIPEGITVIPLKQSMVDHTETRTHYFSEYSAATGSKFAGSIEHMISGALSKEKMNARKEQTTSQRELIQSNLRYSRYEVVARPGMRLSREFMDRVTELTEELMSAYDSLEQAPYADFLAECIVRDFGTHVNTAVEVGAMISRLSIGEHLKKLSSSSSKDSLNVGLNAPSVPLPGNRQLSVNIGVNKVDDKNAKDGSSESRQTSKIYTYGGIPIGPKFTVEQWQANMDNELVSIGNNNEPLDSLITRDAFPHLPPPMVYEARDRLHKAILKYYQRNTLDGCLTPDNTEFSAEAVMNDVTMCKRSKEGYYLGGIYRKHTEYKRWPFYGRRWRHEDYRIGQSLSIEVVGCGKNDKIMKIGSAEKCHDDCEIKLIGRNNNVMLMAGCTPKCEVITVYWCYSRISSEIAQEDHAFHFGGAFDKQQYVNALTSGHACPTGHTEYQFGDPGYVCLTREIEHRRATFGGFFSCQSGNPYANYLQSCPRGFIPTFAFLLGNCEVSYCVKNGAVKVPGGLPIPKLPPFTVISPYAMEQRFSERTIDFGENNVWVSEKGVWKLQKLNQSATTSREVQQMLI